MIYRDFGKTGVKVSAIGMGCEYVWTADEKQIFDLVRAAVDAGINYFDLFVGTPATREYYGKALKGVRDKIYLAGHLGCADKDGQYTKTRDEALCKDFLQQFYEKLDTDYIDVLFLHNCDDEADLNEILNGWMYTYAKELKETGRAGFIGLSSHNTKIALEAVKSEKIDVLMFPVNPLFNLLPQDTADARMKGREVKSMTEEEKDFSEIQESLVGQFANQCMYCNHCQPCPQKIDIAEVTKLADMAEKEMTDELRERYAALLVTGEDCIHCGSCTRRCPFGIDASENMRRAQRLFGC